MSASTATEVTQEMAEMAMRLGLPIIGSLDDIIVDEFATRLLPEDLEDQVIGVGFNPKGVLIAAFKTVPTPASIHDVERRSGVTVEPALVYPSSVWKELKKQVAGHRAKTTTVEPILQEAMKEGASDIHLFVGSAPILRISGDLQPSLAHPEKLSAEDIDEMVTWAVGDRVKREGFSGDLDVAASFANIRLRVNVHLQRDQFSVVMRLIPNRIPKFSDLMLPPKVLEFSELRNGIVLVCGITGSGKSTTLASMIDHINHTRADCAIVTIEDPVEFVHQPIKSIIRQREVGRDTSTFASGMKSALRQDPDVILIGEMRDPESISTALTAAESGHLVFSTIHAQDSRGVVDRIIDSFPGDQQAQIRTQLAASLRGVVCQSLLKTGQGGRVAVCEVMVSTPAIAANIREGRTEQIPGAVHTGSADGMQSFDRALAYAVASGQVPPANAEPYIRNRSEFADAQSSLAAAGVR